MPVSSGAERFSVPINSTTWRCTEDRPLKNHELGPQIAGARSGIVVSRLLASEMAMPGIFTLREVSVDHVEQEEASNINASKHKNCAGREQMKPIIGHIAAEPSKVFETARRMLPDLKLNQFNPIVNAAERMFDLIPVNYASGEGLIPIEPDPKTNQVPGHQAKDVYVFHDTGTTLDTKTAWDAGQPGYGFSLGSLPDLDRYLFEQNLDPSLNYQTTGEFVIAGLTYQAATVNNLPRPDGVDELRIHNVGSPLHIV